MNGHSIEYNIDGYLVFEGEIKNGKKWNGITIDYDMEDGKIIFEGQYVNGIKVKNN